MGTTLTAAKVTGRRGQPRPRRRQPRLPAARRRARAAHARPLAGGRARAHRPDHPGGGRAPSAALDHHAGARARSRDVEVDTYTLTGRDGDVFLICSDGLTSMISDDELRLDPALARTTLEEAAESLVRAANQSGGKDNITVVLFRLGNGDDGDRRCRARTRRSPASSGRPRSTRPRSTRTPSASRHRRRPGAGGEPCRRAAGRDDRRAAASPPRAAPRRRSGAGACASRA